MQHFDFVTLFDLTLTLTFTEYKVHTHGRIQPLGLGGGGTWSDLKNLTYPQIQVSPRISAILFWKYPKIELKKFEY